MALKLSKRRLQEIHDHAIHDYPSECCGVLLGRIKNEAKIVEQIVPITNLRRTDDKVQELLPLPGSGESPLPLPDSGVESDRNRFLIDPKDYMRIERNAISEGLEVLGF